MSGEGILMTSGGILMTSGGISCIQVLELTQVCFGFPQYQD